MGGGGVGGGRNNAFGLGRDTFIVAATWSDPAAAALRLAALLLAEARLLAAALVLVTATRVAERNQEAESNLVVAPSLAVGAMEGGPWDRCAVAKEGRRANRHIRASLRRRLADLGHFLRCCPSVVVRRRRHMSRVTHFN